MHYLVTPAGAMFAILILIIGCKLFARRYLSKVLLFLLIFIFWFFATPITAQWLENRFISMMYPNNLDAFGPEDYDALVVAGWQKAFTLNDFEMDRFWSQRLWSASQEHFKSGKPIIVTSSQYPIPNKPKLGERPYAVNKLAQWGVPEHKIINAEPGRNTYEAMENAYRELSRLNLGDVLLVAYRTRSIRKKQALEQIIKQHSAVPQKVFVKFAEEGLDKVVYNPSHLASWLPNEKTFERSSKITHEIFGQLAYRLGGWI